ncbi:complement C3-like isoform X2 [Hemibagrus wyckioides]|uniref:complement C3-like isoform X2 n=1 Tax=Hemibagrus wyckioides TaxID=337641 RepID=UPI00266C9FC9|nr:complement C3-like isoform X2 [Hemibagrus wyckioides]
MCTFMRTCVLVVIIVGLFSEVILCSIVPYPLPNGPYFPRPLPVVDFERDPKFVLVAPAVLKAGSEENILLEAFGLFQSIDIDLLVHTYPGSSQILLNSTVTLNADNHYSALATITIPRRNLNPEQTETKYVQLLAKFGQRQLLHQISKVSFLSGYIFIQTDKPIYNPGDTVRFRAFVSNPEFQAFNSTVSVEIQNSDEITVHTTSEVRAGDGVYSDTYTLLDIAKEGKWKIVAKFDHFKENMYSTYFEVKKYELPAFNVTLVPEKYHLSLEDEELEVKVYAKYIYGEKVDGVAYVVFGVDNDGVNVRVSSMKQVKNLDGGNATLTVDELKKAYPDVSKFDGLTIYIKASVMTSTGSDLVEAEKSGIKIISSPYVLAIEDTLSFYKTGLPFDVTVTVSHHDGSPAPDVPVKISYLSTPVTEHSGTIKVSLKMPCGFGKKRIKVKTADPNLKPEQQAKTEWLVTAFSPFSMSDPNYLHITVDKKAAKLGEILDFQLHLSMNSQRENNLQGVVSYMVLNKGKIIRSGKMNVTEEEVMTLPLLLTPEMLPAFRFVAYYILPQSYAVEVMADSVLVKLESRCLGSLKLEPLRGETKDSYTPGDSFNFQVRGDPGAKISLVAVDNSIFLLSKRQLTQSKIWDTLGQGDLGCSLGGGEYSMGVFTDAGLNFQSTFFISTNNKKFHSDRFLQRCCSDGMRAIPMPYSCRRRALYITENWSCVMAFLECCSKYRGEELGVVTPPPPTTEPTFPMEDLQYGYIDLDQRHHIEYAVSGRIAVPGVVGPVGVVPGLGGGYGGVPGSIDAFHGTAVLGGGYGGVPGPIDAFHGGPALSGGYGGVPGPFGGYGGGPVLGGGYGDVRGAVGVPGPVGVPALSLSPEHSAAVPDPYGRMGGETGTTFEYHDKLEDIYVRTKFFESWLWTDVQLPGTPGPDGLAVAPVASVLPDSITQWGILGVSASSDTGFCVAEPFNIRAWKPFFIKLRLPRTAARNEHVEVKAVLHNYMSKDLKVLVVLAKTEDMCSVAFTKDHKQEVFVKARSSVLIPYTIIPLRAGELPLQVTAVSQSFTGQDAIRKSLRVVVEGIQKMVVKSFVLDPTVKGDNNGNQLIKVDKAELSSVVPNSLPETFVNVRGNLLADSIDNSINKDSLAALIRMPGGCVEQNLASITLPLIATHYLDRSSQWESVGIQRRDEAISYIKIGYENQLHYRKTDDSYPPYQNEGTSTWITAFVVKVFSMAYPFIKVDKQHICGPLLYLIKHKQSRSGTFKEDNPVYDTSMTGGLQGAETRGRLTAFVLIALAEAKNVVSCSDPEINELGFARAQHYLSTRLKTLGRPYSVAITCYALAVSNHPCSKGVLLESASLDRTHWPDPDNPLFTLEATGYALLALLKGGHIQEAAAPFRWLNQQRRVGGGFGSTQSTLVVLQALSEYMVKNPQQAGMNLKVVLGVPGGSDTHWDFDRKLAHVARSSKVAIDKDFTVLASGTGQGILEVVTVFNELPDIHENSNCNGFDLNVSISESNENPPADVEKVYNLSISVRALEQQVRMAVLDISLPTGFEPENPDLELLTNAVDCYISNFQIVDNLSDRGSLIIHLFKVTNKEADTITFRLNQKFKVGLLQPSTVTVYQYYNTDKRCSRFYTPPEDKEQLSQICKDNICRCTQGDCCVLKTGAQTVVGRMNAACNGNHHGNCNTLLLSANGVLFPTSKNVSVYLMHMLCFPVFKVRVLSVSTSQYDRYELEILQVIKEGAEVGLKEKDTRVFLSHAGCRAGLNLLTSQDYLIIGPSSDVWQAGSDKNGYTYTLGKDTWVELWPSGACDTCTQLERFSTDLMNTGCQT